MAPNRKRPRIPERGFLKHEPASSRPGSPRPRPVWELKDAKPAETMNAAKPAKTMTAAKLP